MDNELLSGRGTRGASAMTRRPAPPSVPLTPGPPTRSAAVDHGAQHQGDPVVTGEPRLLALGPRLAHGDPRAVGVQEDRDLTAGPALLAAGGVLQRDERHGGRDVSIRIAVAPVPRSRASRSSRHAIAASCLCQLQMSRATLSTTREPRRSSLIGSSRMSARLSRTARCRSIGQITTQETAAARAGQLDARGARVERPGDRAVDLLVGHAGGQLPLGFPALPERGPDRVDVAAAQPLDREPGQVAQQVELRQGGRRRSRSARPGWCRARRVMPV